MFRKIVAFAKWQYPYRLTPEQTARKSQLDKVEEMEHPIPEGSNKALYDVFFAALRAKKAKWMDESKDYCRCGPSIYICSQPPFDPGIVELSAALVCLMT